MMLCVMAISVESTAKSDEFGQANTATNYRPFAVEGKTWKCTSWSWGNLVEHSETYTIKGDTVINGMYCKKLYSGQNFRYFVYEQNRKVFAVLHKKGTPDDVFTRLLFDFSLEPCDTVINSNGRGTFRVTVLRVDTIVNSNNDSFRRMLVRTGPLNEAGEYAEKPPYQELYWIEGVGSSRCPEDSYFWPNGSEPGRRMEECFENGECIMTYSEMMAEGSSGVNSVTAPQPLSASIYDLQGRRLSTKPQKGVYIRDGRKIVVK